MIHVAALYDEHVDVRLRVPALEDVPEIPSGETFLAISEKHGEDNSGYLVTRFEGRTGVEYHCTCDDFRFNRIVDGAIVGECKHVDAVKKRNREATEPDQVTLGGGSADGS